ncbi:MAG: hypothetical protein HY077_15060 [Elusimicrobia bacterium]|nr:hypothetical protein [Elusimicrobiota bacterium]
MHELAMAALLILGILCAPCRAEDTMKSRLAALKTWFQHFKEGLDESVVSDEYQKRDIVAVAAVRGAAQDSAEPNKVYWKDPAKAKKAAQLKKEKVELSAALEKILSGNIKEGKTALDSFERAHPKSTLLADARKARDKAKELEDSGGAQ